MKNAVKFKIKSIKDAKTVISSIKDREDITIKWISGKFIVRMIDGKIFVNHYADMIETDINIAAKRLYELRKEYNN